MEVTEGYTKRKDEEGRHEGYENWSDMKKEIGNIF
jgi:hypothetical protein